MMARSADRVATLLPLAVAVLLTLFTVIIHGMAVMPIGYFVRYEFRIGRAGVLFWRDVRIVAVVALIALAAHLFAVATWALVLTLLGEFSHLSAALYHSAMNYTTLGDSNTVMSPSWRMLASFEAANGMLMFGVSTAMLFAVIQRLFQTRFREPVT